MPCNKTAEKAEGGNLGGMEGAESSAATSALFKENIPRRIDIADTYMNLHKLPEKSGRQLEAAEEGGTLMGRLAARMTSRDMIDELSLGPKGKSAEAKKAAVADNFKDDMKKIHNMKDDGDAKVNAMIERQYKEFGTKKDKKMLGMADMSQVPSKLMLGPGLHEQARDLKASNMNDPIQNRKSAPGRNMAEQAKNAGNVFDTMQRKEVAENCMQSLLKEGERPDTDFVAGQLKMGIEVEKEHTNDPEVAKQIAKAHLVELPDYYTRLAKMEKEGKKKLGRETQK